MPSILFIFLMVFIITKIQKPEKEINGKDYFRQKYAECGKMSVREIKSAIILIFYLTFIIFHDQLFANWNMSWGLAFIPMLFAVPGIGAAAVHQLEEDPRKIRWSPLSPHPRAGLHSVPDGTGNRGYHDWR